MESFVTDANTWREHQDEVPTMEFYETDELGNQLDNWIGPSVSCLMAMCRAAGFARVEFLHTTGLSRGGRVPSEVGSRSRRMPARRAGTAGGGEFTDLRRQFFHAQGGIPHLLVPHREGQRHARSSCGWKWDLRCSSTVREAGRKRILARQLPPAARPARGWNAVRLRFADSYIRQRHAAYRGGSAAARRATGS